MYVVVHIECSSAFFSTILSFDTMTLCSGTTSRRNIVLKTYALVNQDSIFSENRVTSEYPETVLYLFENRVDLNQLASSEAS